MKHAGDLVPRSEAVRALAGVDRDVTVPARVETAVMAAWDDAHAAARRGSRFNLRHIVALAAAAAIAIALLSQRSKRPSVPPTIPDRQTADVAPRRAETPPAPTATAPARKELVRPRRAAIRPPAVDASADDVGLALVVDPMFDPARARVVRLRMPRASLASFGVPIAHPEAAGDVDVEIIVGEDGLARVIRRVRAVPPNSTQEP